MRRISVLAACWLGAGVASVATAEEASPAECNKTMTAERFAGIFHDIAMHGDLTDVRYTEKKLGTKFTAKPTTEGDQAGHRMNYTSPYIFDAKAYVDYGVLDDPSMQKKWGWIATLRVNFYDPCITMHADRFGHYFDPPKDRITSAITDGGGTSWSQTMPVKTKDGSTIRVAWSDSSANHDVMATGVVMFQEPPPPPPE